MLYIYSGRNMRIRVTVYYGTIKGDTFIIFMAALWQIYINFNSYFTDAISDKFPGKL